MSYYGGTITVKGRDLITSLIAGETIEFTRIVVGSGEMPEGVEPHRHGRPSEPGRRSLLDGAYR